MSTRILLVRAVNVGGASLPMAEFRELLESLGATDVRTYIASGNAVCAVDGDAVAFDRELERGIEARFGYFREVMSRTPGEVNTALAVHPFEVIDPAFSYVSFLSDVPSDAAIERALEVRTGEDRWLVVGRELHIRYAKGAGQAELNMDALGRRLGVAMTARNLRTVQALIDLAG
jgi:uncharacterized protein (DUF1697 family)